MRDTSEPGQGDARRETAAAVSVDVVDLANVDRTWLDAPTPGTPCSEVLLAQRIDLGLDHCGGAGFAVHLRMADGGAR